MNEALLGYPIFAWFAIGHLQQAEEELIKDYPDEAAMVRTERVNYLEGLKFTLQDEKISLISSYHMDTHRMLVTLTYLAIEGAGDDESDIIVP